MLSFSDEHEPERFNFVLGNELNPGPAKMNVVNAAQCAWAWLGRSRYMTMGCVKPTGEWIELAREMASFAIHRFREQNAACDWWSISEHTIGMGPLDSYKLVRRVAVGPPDNLTECLVTPASVTEEQEVEYIILAWWPWKPDTAEIKRIRKADGGMEKDFWVLVGGVRNDSKAHGSGYGIPSKAPEA